MHCDDNDENSERDFIPPEAESNEQGAILTSENNDRSAPIGAPAERTDAPIPEKISHSSRMFSMYNFERSFAPRADEWSEPSYSQTCETMSDMYTPGIYVNDMYSRKHDADIVPERKAVERSGSFGKAMRAVCLILVCVILSGAVSYGVIEYRFNRGDFSVVNQVVLGGSTFTQNSSGLSASVSATGSGMPPEDIYSMACTQVVGITTITDNPSGMFFGNVIPGSTVAVAGSGFIISSDGYILTNYHVVESAYLYDMPLVVFLNDGTEFEAKVVGYEASNDVALIKIATAELNPATIANSDSINVGQAVYAVGNPLGELVYTMTEGIVSARNREVSVEGKTINTFQFSAAVNSGNSGGPLYDSNGEVIGIVTAKPMTASVEGIGFAIPINDAIEIAAELIEFGYITGRPYMGIEPQTVSGANAEYWGWVVGVRVKTVFPDTAAEKAGMMIGDIITELGETEIDSVETLRFILKRYRAGDTATLSVWRDGENVELTITFDEDLSAGQASPR